jgi:O-antigen/teichoic acid export membrane protein
VAVAAFGGSFVQRVLMGAMLRRHLPGITFRRSEVRMATFKELLSFSQSVFVIKLTDAARYRIHNLLIAPLAGIIAVTHYSVAVRLSDYFQAMVVRISSVSQPVYSRHHAQNEEDELRKKFLTISRMGSAVCGLFAASAVVFGRSFVKLWLGPGFNDTYVALSILMVGMFFALLQSPSRDVLRVIYKHQFDAKTNTIEVIVNLILTVALVPYFGIIGAAIGTVLPMIVVKTIFLPRYICNAIKLPLATYYKSVGLPILVTLAFSLLFAALVPLQRVPNLAMLAMAGIGFNLLLGIILLYSLPSDNKRILVGALGRQRIGRMPGGYAFIRSLGID